jgi:multidrug efflux pump subunit AcrB
LKPAVARSHVLQPFYNWFNRVFGSITNGYISFTTILVRNFVVGLVLIGGLVWLTMGFVQRIPAGFVPEETKATSSSTRCCPMRRPSNARTP